MLAQVARGYFRFIFGVILARSARSKVAVFDLDNTLFDTWPLRTQALPERMIYDRVRPFTHVVELVNQLRRDGFHVLFITSRRFRFYGITFRSLLRIFSWRVAGQLVLVESPEDKIPYLELLIARYTLVHYYDDLSYNHEHGEVKTYQEVIERVNKLRLVYFNAGWITKLQNGKVD